MSPPATARPRGVTQQPLTPRLTTCFRLHSKQQSASFFLVPRRVVTARSSDSGGEGRLAVFWTSALSRSCCSRRT
ncbi:hypothetical protein CSUI_007449 [Cystoisospora suis]|uniref:Uncharacterized protein n=1 Tax=Cystoisospora suis TaxID=483139 RepID=A0A2C6JUY4_9APIC|nr:hypothetical protein CSUI_007449 [Cystoisospora suis]